MLHLCWNELFMEQCKTCSRLNNTPYFFHLYFSQSKSFKTFCEHLKIDSKQLEAAKKSKGLGCHVGESLTILHFKSIVSAL